MTVKRDKCLKEVESLLRENDRSGDSLLTFLPLPILQEILAYLAETPRTTSIGYIMTGQRAAYIIEGTLKNGGDIRLSMRLDCLDNRYRKIANSLSNAGVVIDFADLKDISDADALRFTALLHAEELVFSKLHYHPDKKTKKLAGLYKYVEENPASASRIMEVATERYSLDVGMIKEVLEMEVPALEVGVL